MEDKGKVYGMHTRVNLMAAELQKAERLLEKGSRERRTKAEMCEALGGALGTVRDCSSRLMKARSALTPITPMDAANTLFDELQKAADDIGTVQWMLAQGDIAGADRLLADIKKRM